MKVSRSTAGTSVRFQVNWIFQLKVRFSACDFSVRCKVKREYVNIINEYVDAFSSSTPLTTS